MQQRNTIAGLREKIRKTRKSIAIPVTIAIFSTLAQPSFAQTGQNTSKDSIKIELSQDTINMKPIKERFYKLIVKTPEQKLGIDSLRTPLESYPREYQAAVKRMVQYIYRDPYSTSYAKVLLIGAFLDPEKKNSFGQLAYQKIEQKPEVKQRMTSLLQLFQSTIGEIKATIELEKAKLDLEKAKQRGKELDEALKILEERKKIFESYEQK